MQYADFLILETVGFAAKSLVVVELDAVLVNLPITRGLLERVTVAYEGLSVDC